MKPIAVATTARQPVAPTDDNALLRMLRTHTGALHQALDGRLRVGDDMRPADYAAFLRATSAVVVPLEVPLALRLGPLFVHEHAGERRRLLARDLESLGTTLAPPWPSLPAVDSFADALGVAYVLLGSHLGGEVIARTLAGRTAQPEAPVRYLRLYGADLGRMWRAFTDALGRHSRSVDDTRRQHVAAVAVATFTAFGLALDREGVDR